MILRSPLLTIARRDPRGIRADHAVRVQARLDGHWIVRPRQLPVNYRKRPANTGVNTDGCTGSSARNFVARRHEILQESSQKFRVPRSASKFANCSSVRIYTSILWSPPVINPVIGRCDAATVPTDRA